MRVYQTFVPGYFPFGFRYPAGLAHSDANPDQVIDDIHDRMSFLNEVHALTGLPGQVFAAAMDHFQNESDKPKEEFWKKIMSTVSKQELADIANALAPDFMDEPERLDFPNAIALFDCRFVATKEWERVRRYSIGGSEAATVLGKSHFQTRLSLYHEKRTVIDEEFDIGKEHIFNYGHRVEDYIVEEVASRLGAVRYPEWRMFAHKDYPFLTCNPDGILKFPDGHFALFEAKTAFWLKWNDWKQIPDYYAPQPRHYMEVLNDPKLTEGYIGVCFGGRIQDIVCHHYVRDKEAGAAQIKELVAFWTDHIAAGVLPAFSGNGELDHEAFYKYNNILNMNSVETPLPAEAVRLFEDYFQLAAARKTLNTQVAELKATEEKLKEQIRNCVDEGMTLTTSPDNLTYKIVVKNGGRATVNSTMLKTIDPNAYRFLMVLSQTMKEKKLKFTNPKVIRS